jgi:hypothetical protein
VVNLTKSESVLAEIMHKKESLEFKEQYQVKISKGFSALENLDDDGDISKARENIKVNIKSLAAEVWVVLKQHKTWHDEK